MRASLDAADQAQQCPVVPVTSLLCVNLIVCELGTHECVSAFFRLVCLSILPTGQTAQAGSFRLQLKFGGSERKRAILVSLPLPKAPFPLAALSTLSKDRPKLANFHQGTGV
jgi:hypothetical protein